MYFFRDLVKGKSFEFEGAREDYDSELYDVLDEDALEHIKEESIKLNPWQHKFAELKQQMVELKPGVWKKIGKRMLFYHYHARNL